MKCYFKRGGNKKETRHKYLCDGNVILKEEEIKKKQDINIYVMKVTKQ